MRQNPKAQRHVGGHLTGSGASGDALATAARFGTVASSWMSKRVICAGPADGGCFKRSAHLLIPNLSARPAQASRQPWQLAGDHLRPARQPPAAEVADGTVVFAAQ